VRAAAAGIGQITEAQARIDIPVQRQHDMSAYAGGSYFIDYADILVCAGCYHPL